MLTESLLLACLAGLLGVLLASWGKDVLMALRPWGGGALSLDLKLDLRVLGFTAAISMLTGVLFGLAPALRATKVDLTDSLKDGAESSGGSRSRLGKSLIALQMALSLVLLIGAGLFIRTLHNLQNVDVGFNAEKVLLFRADARVSGHRGEQIVNVYRQMTERINAIPGVRRASFSSHMPMTGGYARSTITVLGQAPKNTQIDNVWEYHIAAKFFETLEIPLLRGRSLTEQDHAEAPKVAVVNQAFVRRFFPDDDPIGTRFFMGQNAPNDIPDPKSLIEIVGLVRDAKYATQRQDIPPAIFLPVAQNSNGFGQTNFSVRTAGDPLPVISAIRDAVRQLDPNLPLYSFTTVSAQAEERLVQERLFARLTSFFGLLAIGLASIGLYGVMAYSIARRTHEIGVRMALGAQSADVARMIFRESMFPVVIGVMIGLGVALVSFRLLSSMLYGLRPADPMAISLAVLVMLAVAVLASYLPARRASRVDPLVALRYE